MEKLYKLKYKGKWMVPIRMLGSYTYELKESDDEIKPMSKSKACAFGNLICGCCGIDAKDIELIEI